MAVSGRKISDYGRSGSKGSAEVFEHSCVPCLSDGQHIQAQGFCVECQEYLCQNCRQCHRKTNASKHHQLIDIDKIGENVPSSKTPEVCTEICSTHRSEVIKFFCPKHEQLGCHDCMTLSHRTCKLDYIPDVCVGISDSREYLDTLKNLDLKKGETEAVMKRAEDKIKEIDVWYDDAIKDVERIRKEINDHLDTIEKKIKEEAKRGRSTDKQEVKAVLESYTNLTSDIRKVKIRLKDLTRQNKNSDVFIALKRAKSKLEFEVMRGEAVLDKNTKLLFECNKAIENILSIDYFGKLTEHKTNVTIKPNMQTSDKKPITSPPGKRSYRSVSHKADINIKTKADRLPCNITGCAVVSSDQLILADCNNNKLKVLNTVTKAVEEKQLDSLPFDVAVLPEDQIAVTMPDKKEIIIMRTTGQLSTSRRIKVQGRCRGITYNHDLIYMVCGHPKCVLIMDLQGKVKNTIPLKDEAGLNDPQYIEVGKDNKLLYISYSGSKSIESVSLEGEISVVNKDIRIARGQVMLDDGSLLVCSYITDNIYRLQADLKHSYKVVSGLNRPWSICYCPEKSVVYVGGYCDAMKAFSLQ